MYRVCVGCGGMAPAGGSCPVCRRARSARRADRDYGHHWRVGLRRQQLRREPLCQYVSSTGQRCARRATDVDHIVPRAEGGADALGNLQSLCHSHHSMKTSAQNPQTNRGRARTRRTARQAALGCPEGT